MAGFRSDLLKAKPAADISVPRKKHMMCLNESTLNPFEALRNEILANLGTVPLNRYFNPVTDRLEKKLASYVGHDITPEHLIFGNGADEMLYFSFIAVRETPASFAVSLAPSYFDYSTYSRAVGLGIKFLPLQDDFDFDLDTYMNHLHQDGCTLAILCHPNNPTGNLLDEDKIRHVIEHSPVPVLLDETYFEFSGKTFVDQVHSYPNLMIVRSFSKSFSGSGLRFGYLVSSKESIAQLKKVMTIFHSSLLIQTFAETMLDNQALFADHNQLILKEKVRLQSRLEGLAGMKVYSSATNFLLFTIGNSSADLFLRLQERDIAIRDVGAHPLIKNHLRVTIGSPEQNDFFFKTVAEFMEERNQEPQ